MAMGNYPYASSYIMHGDSLLPPWPVRAACAHFRDVDVADDGALFEAVRQAAATFHNNTGTAQCFHITESETVHKTTGATQARQTRMTTSMQPSNGLGDSPYECKGEHLPRDV